jgi:hypothetical protein
MANMLQSSQTQATTAPSYYTDYLSNLASAGKAAVDPTTGAQFIGAQPLQTTAFGEADAGTKAYQPTLTQAGTTLGSAGTSASPLTAATSYLTDATSNPALAAQQYMNPYITSVVNSLGEAGQRNIRQNLAPGAVAGAIGGGQFGSKRGAEVLGQTLTNANRDILNKQNEALTTGYGQALQAATTQNQIEGQAGATAANAASAGQQNLTNLGTAQSNLAGQNQALELARLNALSTLGGQEQTIKQNKELFPLQNLTTLSGLLRGYTTPTATTTTAEMSPLSALAAVGAGTAGLFTGSGTTGTGPSLFNNIKSALGAGADVNPFTQAFSDGLNTSNINYDFLTGMDDTQSMYRDENGNLIDSYD